MLISIRLPVNRIVLAGWLFLGTLVFVGCQDAAAWAAGPAGSPTSEAKYLILMIADGWGYRHIDAANQYAGQAPPFQSWDNYAVSTYPAGASYDPGRAWTEFNYIDQGFTDSAAAATAMYTGQKTANGRIAVSTGGALRFYTITELARGLGKASGAVTSVYLSHATPGAWIAHNDARANGFAIADEGLWGDPNTTGTPGDDPHYGGGRGTTLPPFDVLIGAGHPAWHGANYVNAAIRDLLAAESGATGAYNFVERIDGSPDGGARLLAAAADPSVMRLAGLFGSANGNLDWRLADGSGANPENPTLAEMTEAALLTLDRNPKGFILLVEGGAVDWAGHGNNMDRMVGEMLGFYEAVQTVTDWVDSPWNGSSWSNTLVVITGDHETGHLTAGPAAFPDQPLGEISPATLAQERLELLSGNTAGWQDTNGDSKIDPGETVYWMWHSPSHTNSLIPLYTQGAGAQAFAAHISGADPVRGDFIDNISIFWVLRRALALQLFFPFLQN